MATASKSGKGRVAPVVQSGPSGRTSLDDDPRQRPETVVGFTIQDQVQQNNTDGKGTSPYNMII